MSTAASEVAGAARALCLDVIDLVSLRVRASAEVVVGLALAGIVLFLGWIASMVALAAFLLRWWPFDGAVAAVAGVHLAMGAGLIGWLHAAGRRGQRAPAELADEPGSALEGRPVGETGPIGRSAS